MNQELEIKTLSGSFMVGWNEKDKIADLKLFLSNYLSIGPNKILILLGASKDNEETITLQETDLVKDIVKNVSYIAVVIDDVPRKKEINDKDHYQIVTLIEKNDFNGLSLKLNEFEKIIISESAPERKTASDAYLNWYRYKLDKPRPLFPPVIDMSAVKYNIQNLKTNLLKALKGNQLPHLSLKQINSFTVQDATNLVESLEDNNVLSVLEIKNIFKIQQEALEMLMSILDNRKPLVGLNLQNSNKNGIDDNGARIIANALYTNHTLTKLNLVNSNITQEGARELCRALQINHTLENLLLDDKRMEPYARRRELGYFIPEELADIIGDRPTPIVITLPNKNPGYQRDIVIRNITFKFPSVNW